MMSTLNHRTLNGSAFRHQAFNYAAPNTRKNQPSSQTELSNPYAFIIHKRISRFSIIRFKSTTHLRRTALRVDFFDRSPGRFRTHYNRPFTLVRAISSFEFHSTDPPIKAGKTTSLRAMSPKGIFLPHCHIGPIVSDLSRSVKGLPSFYYNISLVFLPYE